MAAVVFSVAVLMPMVAAAEDTCIFPPPAVIANVNDTVITAQAVSVTRDEPPDDGPQQWTVDLEVTDIHRRGKSEIEIGDVLTWRPSECGRPPAIGFKTGESYILGIGQTLDAQAEGVRSRLLAVWNLSDGKARLLRSVYNQPGGITRRLAAARTAGAVLTLLGADQLPPTDASLLPRTEALGAIPLIGGLLTLSVGLD